MSMTLLIVIGVLVVLAGWAIGVYNGLVQARNRFKNAFAQIDVQLKRRYDLIPNLVETAKGYMKHERETLEAVIAARNQAFAAANAAAAAPTDGAAMRALAGAEGALRGVLGRLMVVVEQYPDLKANTTFLEFQEALQTVEDEIQMARRYYNGAVRNLNVMVESVPSNFIAGPFGFQKAQYFELENEAERAVPTVKFN